MLEPDVLDDLAGDLRRVVDRLRSLSQGQLAASVPPFTSRADAARHLAQVLADAASGFEAAEISQEQPIWRSLPQLGDFAAGDLVAVPGHDLLAVASRLPRATSVWTSSGRRPAADVLAEVAQLLADVRRLL